MAHCLEGNRARDQARFTRGLLLFRGLKCDVESGHLGAVFQPRPKNYAAETHPGIWLALFGATLLWLGFALASEIDRPWINGADYNGAVWSQAAHNILRAGLTETSGASSGFYFGPLPIPPWGYYLHHPPLLHLVIAALFSLFGEYEWVARLVPVGCSLLSLVFFWLLVRSCGGVRLATLAAAVFACLPMQLRYGAMVNFEPCVLMLILGGLLCLRWHSLTGRLRWKLAAAGFLIIGLWVDWAMYLFVVALCACWLLPLRGERRFAAILLLSALFSGALYLVRVRSLRADAWQSMSNAFVTRLGAGKGGYFTEMQWLERIGHTLTSHFLPIGLILAATGAVILWRSRSDDNLRWLGRAALSILLMDLLFVGIFQNDSYIHEYIAFYFLAPIAIAAGVALEFATKSLQKLLSRGPAPRLAEVAVALAVLAIGFMGYLKNETLVRRFCILDYHTNEPEGLIPDLGRAIRANFTSETHVLCNFLPDYGPQLAYYAQRDILNNLSEYRFWDPHLRDASKKVGGVVWLSSQPASHNILAKLPTGQRRFLTVGNLTFCLWNREDSKKP